MDASTSRHRRKPRAGAPRSPWLLNHLIGARQERCRHSEAEGFGGFLIDRQFEHRWLFDRQVGGLAAFQDIVDIVMAGARDPVATGFVANLAPRRPLGAIGADFGLSARAVLGFGQTFNGYSDEWH